MKIKVVASLLLISLLPSTSFAHSGGTNSDGCHNDRVNGGYHCHNEEESLSDGAIAAIVILSVGLTVWYYYDKSSNNHLDFEKTKSAHDNLSFSLLPTSPDSLDGIMLNASYAF